jgi:pre-60S factor REI1
MRLTDTNSVNNLKRKVSGLPAMIERDFQAQQGRSEDVVTHRPRTNEDTLMRKPRMKSHNANSEHDTDSEAPVKDGLDDHPGKVPSTQCLFCPFLSSTHAINLEHMSTAHSLFIPELSRLYSLDSLLSYLAVLVFEYHECLYCRQEKGTVEAVQTHMRDKGHCMIDTLDLVDFWDTDTDATVSDPSKTEKRLPSGLVINSQHSLGNETLSRLIKPKHVRSRHRASQRCDTTTTAISTRIEHRKQETPANSPSRQLALRNSNTGRHLITTPRTAKGLAGLSDQQLRTLQIEDKKMRSREENAKAKVRYAAQQQPVKTVYYKTENPVYQAG